MKNSLIFTMILLAGVMISGCSNAWNGAEKDTSDNAQWSKDKVNDGAKYIEKKTQ